MGIIFGNVLITAGQIVRLKCGQAVLVDRVCDDHFWARKPWMTISKPSPIRFELSDAESIVQTKDWD